MLPKGKMKYHNQVTAILTAINISNTTEPVPSNANYRLVSTGIDHSSLANKPSRLNCLRGLYRKLCYF